MATPSPPKPWERAGGGMAGNTRVSQSSPLPASTTATSTSNSSSAPPDLPQRPSTLSTVANRTASNYATTGAAGGLNANRYGASTYGGMTGGLGGMGSYSSPYSRMGGYGSSMYGGMGGMGGYGSMYGGMGGMGGMGGYGAMGGMGGMDPNDPSSLTNSFSQSTQATFQIIESIVGAFGGFAQMLESTYMATHSSFFAMVQVAEQFSSLRNTFGSILGIFTLLRWFRTLLAKITGRPPPSSPSSLTPANFAAFEGRPITLPDGTLAPASLHPKPSKKPFLVFLLAAFGLPYLMGKLIKVLAKSQEEAEAKRLSDQGLLGPNGESLHAPGQSAEPLDPSKLEFCRLLYDFPPPTHDPAAISGIDLEVKKGDLVAVLSKLDPLGQPSEWWRCRARDGRVGYLPGVYVEAIPRRGGSGRVKEITGDSRAGSLRSQTSEVQAGKAVEGATTAAAAKAQREMKPADISVEGFLKGQFH